MRRTGTVIAVTLAAVALGASGAATAETLRVGTECTYAPFNYRTADGELTGYDVDVARGVGELIGAELEFVCQKWDGMIPALLANKFDLIVASMSITEERLQKIDFSAPYRVSIGRFIGAEDRDFHLFNDDGTVDPASFAGLKIGIGRATTYDNWIKAKIPDADVLLYDNDEAMYLDLQNGRSDVIMTNPMKAYLKFLAEDGGEGFEFVSPAIDEVEYFGVGVGIGVRKGNDALLERVNGALKSLIENGEMERYSLKYFPFAIHPQQWAGVQ